MSSAKDAARKLIALTGYEVTFTVKNNGMVGILLEVLFEDSDFEAESCDNQVTIRRRKASPTPHEKGLEVQALWARAQPEKTALITRSSLISAMKTRRR
jgi:hypothetical protein